MQCCFSLLQVFSVSSAGIQYQYCRYSVSVLQVFSVSTEGIQRQPKILLDTLFHSCGRIVQVLVLQLQMRNTV